MDGIPKFRPINDEHKDEAPAAFLAEVKRLIERSSPRRPVDLVTNTKFSMSATRQSWDDMSRNARGKTDAHPSFHKDRPKNQSSPTSLYRVRSQRYVSQSGHQRQPKGNSDISTESILEMDMQPPRRKVDQIDPLIMRRGMLCSIVNFPELPAHIPRITNWSKSAGANNLKQEGPDFYIRLSNDPEAARILYTWSPLDGTDDSCMLIAWYYSEVTLREHGGAAVAAYWPWRADLILSDHLQVVTSASVL
ncbi:Hypothetical protein D9617_61g013230 [Elsinoe fawcettii]|nr:Hypothetical protein D9617_61g013230 [Elsinoe fawcettii]